MSRKARIDSAILILSKIDAIKARPINSWTPDDKRAISHLRQALNRLPSTIYHMAVASYDPNRPKLDINQPTAFKVTTLPPADVSQHRAR